MIGRTLKVATFPALWPVWAWRYALAPIEDEAGWPALIYVPRWVPLP